MGWASYSLIQFALLGCGLGLSLYLFLSLKCEIQAGRKRQKTLESALSRLQAELTGVRAELTETEERAARSVPAAPTRTGLNLSIRSQALRMARRGDTTQQVSAALGIPEKEVELLVKVQRMTPPAGDPPPAEASIKPASSGLEALLAEVARAETAGTGTPKPEPPKQPRPAPTALEMLLAESARVLRENETAAAGVS